jgi:hypothetical protein
MSLRDMLVKRREGVEFALMVLDECTCKTCTDWKQARDRPGWGSCHSTSSKLWIQGSGQCHSGHGCHAWREK